MNRLPIVSVPFVMAAACLAQAAQPVALPASAHNLLLEAKVSGNLETYGQGLRGQPDDMIYDPQRGHFVKQHSPWHEYGIGFGREIGVVLEDKPAFWMAEWAEAVPVNFIAFSGAYPNQPQPDTGWKIETRRKGEWTTLARGRGGWYDAGRYVWGGRATKPLTLDAVRVSLFSADRQTPLKSIHFRGEMGVSWVVAHLRSFDARIVLPPARIRAGRPAQLAGEVLAGKVQAWAWTFEDGQTATGQTVTHTFAKPGPQTITLAFSDGAHTAKVQKHLDVAVPIAAQIMPLMTPVIVNQPVAFDGSASFGKARSIEWAFGDGHRATGPTVRHVYPKPGIYRVTLTAFDGRYRDACQAIIRVHTPETIHVPQVFLDTDQKNEVDDQHYLAYALFGELDVLGVNSIHHGGGQEMINYGEILNIIDLSKKSGLPVERVPFVFRGADERLKVPETGRWQDTEPIVTAASEGILAAARGASPSNPVWVLPVGPGTNVASAILQARAERLKLKDRLKIVWLGGSDHQLINEFNGNNDPWSAYVMTQGGLDLWILPNPVSGRIRMDVRTEADLYPDNPLGRYLKKIVPRASKSLYDPACVAAVLSVRLDLGWIKQVDTVTVAGPQGGYGWTQTGCPTNVRVITQIDPQAMKTDVFDTLNGRPRHLIGRPQKQK